MANYSLDQMPQRAYLARTKHQDYIDDCLQKYVQARRGRRARGFKEIAFGGMGRAGKDTAAEYLCRKLEIIYPQSASRIILPVVATIAEDDDYERVFTVRHQHRRFWIEACHAIRGEDYGLLARMCLGAGDVAVGLRGKLEVKQVKEDGTIDLLIWIDKDVEVDPTVEFQKSDCHITVANHGTLPEFYKALDAIIPQLRW